MTTSRSAQGGGWAASSSEAVSDLCSFSCCRLGALLTHPPPSQAASLSLCVIRSCPWQRARGHRFPELSQRATCPWRCASALGAFWVLRVSCGPARDPAPWGRIRTQGAGGLWEKVWGVHLPANRLLRSVRTPAFFASRGVGSFLFQGKRN